MNFLKDMIIEWTGSSTDDPVVIQDLTERVIHISPDGEQIVTMDIFTKTGFPKIYLKRYFEDAYDNGDFRILEYDPKAKTVLLEDQISEKHRRIRDDAYKLVEAVLSEAGEGIYLEHRRGHAIKKVCAENGKPEKTVYFYLRKYWQGGCIKNALLPDYLNCGGSGKRRLPKSESAVKLGRPHNKTKTSGKPFGVRVTKNTESLFKKGANEFYLHKSARSLMDAYKKTLIKYFNAGYKKDIDGVMVPIMPPKAELPSYGQFRYWYRRYKKDPKQEQIARYGETSYNLTGRDLLGDSTSLASGPGAVYMIDATIADVYLISSFDRTRIIGKPIVYLIADVYSRMIVGFSVSLEGPSWLGACLALDNMVSDKVELCAGAGITIAREEWDCSYLPEAIFADRGEFEGYAAETLVSSLGIRIHNTAPYRGDLKGIVERAFGIANEKFIHFLPGEIHSRQPGEKPSALDACLTLDDFRRLLISHIIDHNTGCEMDTYRAEKDLIADNILLRPNLIWDWGIRNRSGYLRRMSRDIVRLNLLPRKEVSIYQEGIHFYEDVFYLKPQKPSFGKKKIEIAYNPENMDVVYLPSKDGRNALVSPLIPACAVYAGHSYEEIRDKIAIEKNTAFEGADQALAVVARTDARQQRIIAKARRQTDAAWEQSEHQSDNSRLKGIRKNRREERAIERRENSLAPAAEPRLLPPQKSHPDDIIKAELLESSEGKSKDDKKFVVKPKFRKVLNNAIKNKKRG